MKTSDVLVTVPTRGSIRWETVTALEAARDYDGFPPIIYRAGNLSVARTRNEIVARFMGLDLPALAMVDDDVAPPRNFVELLLPHLEDFDMVAIPHAAPHPSDPSLMHITAYDLVPEEGFRPTPLWKGRVQQVDAVATGCVLIRRSVFEVLGHAPFRISDDPAYPIRSDDLLFCMDMHDAGLKVGAFWDGYPADHFQTVSLGPLADRQFAENRKAVLLP